MSGRHGAHRRVGINITKVIKYVNTKVIIFSPGTKKPARGGLVGNKKPALGGLVFGYFCKVSTCDVGGALD